jgi:hypothetical protein
MRTVPLRPAAAAMPSAPGKLALFRALPGLRAPRDAQDLMAYPFFSLAKSRRTTPIDFRSGDVSILVEGATKHERFLFRENKLPELVDEAACIEIVAPVMTGWNMHWKGLYQGEPISFAMRDSDYKQAVSNRTVSFQRGDSIACLLHTERKLDPTGEVIVTGRYVSLVLEKRSSSGQSAETPQGKRKRFSEKLASAQSSLPFSAPESETK